MAVESLTAGMENIPSTRELPAHLNLATPVSELNQIAAQLHTETSDIPTPEYIWLEEPNNSERGRWSQLSGYKILDHISLKKQRDFIDRVQQRLSGNILMPGSELGGDNFLKSRFIGFAKRYWGLRIEDKRNVDNGGYYSPAEDRPVARSDKGELTPIDLAARPHNMTTIIHERTHQLFTNGSPERTMNWASIVAPKLAKIAPPLVLSGIAGISSFIIGGIFLPETHILPPETVHHVNAFMNSYMLKALLNFGGLLGAGFGIGEAGTYISKRLSKYMNIRAEEINKSSNPTLALLNESIAQLSNGIYFDGLSHIGLRKRLRISLYKYNASKHNSRDAMAAFEQELKASVGEQNYDQEYDRQVSRITDRLYLAYSIGIRPEELALMGKSYFAIKPEESKGIIEDINLTVERLNSLISERIKANREILNITDTDVDTVLQELASYENFYQTNIARDLINRGEIRAKLCHFKILQAVNQEANVLIEDLVKDDNRAILIESASTMEDEGLTKEFLYILSSEQVKSIKKDFELPAGTRMAISLKLDVTSMNKRDFQNLVRGNIEHAKFQRSTSERCHLCLISKDATLNRDPLIVPNPAKRSLIEIAKENQEKISSIQANLISGNYSIVVKNMLASMPSKARGRALRFFRDPDFNLLKTNPPHDLSAGSLESAFRNYAKKNLLSTRLRRSQSTG